MSDHRISGRVLYQTGYAAGERVERKRIREAIKGLYRLWFNRMSNARKTRTFEYSARAVQALDDALAATRAPRKRSK